MYFHYYVIDGQKETSCTQAKVCMECLMSHPVALLQPCKELQSIAKSSNFYFHDQYSISISTLLISIIAISVFQFPFDSENIIVRHCLVGFHVI